MSISANRVGASNTTRSRGQCSTGGFKPYTYRGTGKDIHDDRFDLPDTEEHGKTCKCIPCIRRNRRATLARSREERKQDQQ